MVDPSSSHYIVTTSSDSININCVVEGEGYVYWQKDGINISDSFMTITSSGNILTINNVTKSDEGEYRCIASNIAGSEISDVANITINGKYFLCQLQ